MKLGTFDRAFYDAMLQHNQLMGPVHFAYKVGGAPESYLRDHLKVPADRMHNTIKKAHDEIKNAATGLGEQIHAKAYLTPDSHTQTAALTWSADMTHLIGMFPDARMNQRSRIGHSATVSPMLTVSGYGNCFENLYFMHGLNNATDLKLLEVSGDRNSFINCHFGAPMHAAPADEAGFNPINLLCGEVFFKNCTFGVDTIAMSDGTMLRLYGPADRSVRAVFENCNFIMNSDAAGCNFIVTTSGQGRGFAIFKNCMFINQGTALTLGIDGTGLGNFRMYFDINSQFAGCTDVVTAANEASVKCAHGGYKSADALNNMLMTSPDVS